MAISHSICLPVIGLTILLAGCGGSGSDSGASSPADAATVTTVSNGIAVTLGNDVESDGESLDKLHSNMLVNETDIYTNSSDLSENIHLERFAFYARQVADPVTPFVVRVNRNNDFTVLAVGTTRTDYIVGTNRVAFSDSGVVTLTLNPGETLATGFLDANADGSGGDDGAVIPWDQGGDELWFTGGSASGSVSVELSPITGSSLRTGIFRNYHYQIGFTVVSVDDKDAEDTISKDEGTGSNDTDDKGTGDAGAEGDGTDDNGTGDSGTGGNGTDDNGTGGTGEEGDGTDGNGTGGTGADGNGVNDNGTGDAGAEGDSTDDNGTGGTGVDGNGTDENGTQGGAEDVNNLVYSCTRFINADSGNDGDTGASPGAAWKTLDHVAKVSRDTGLSPGEVICFKRGQRHIVANGVLGAGAHGTETQPIVFGAYGDDTAARPRLSPAIRIDDAPDWIDLGNGTYLWPNSHAAWNVNGVWEDQLPLKRASSSALSDGDWFYKKGEGVYIRSGSGHPSGHQIFFAKGYAVFGIHQAEYLVFTDLAFEYAGNAISGSVFAAGGARSAGSALEMHHITIGNCDFRYISTAVQFRSGTTTVDDVAYENHDIDIIGNTFSDVRFAIQMMSETNGPERHYNIRIQDNDIQNVALKGTYVPPKGIDVEAIVIQNPGNSIISGNHVRHGVKESEGYLNPAGKKLFSVGIILWRHPDRLVENVRVEGNRLHDLSRGLIIGAGPQAMMSNTVIANNVVTESEIGLKINGRGVGDSYSVVYNTFYRNQVSMSFAPIGAQHMVGNLSVEPMDYHVEFLASDAGAALINSNGYVPDGPLFRRMNTSDGSNSTVYDNLSAWQFAFAFDAGSLTGSSAPFIQPEPLVSADFRLTATSAFIDYIVDTTTGIDVDFGGQLRPAGPAADIGAWEYQQP